MTARPMLTLNLRDFLLMRSVYSASDWPLVSAYRHGVRRHLVTERAPKSVRIRAGAERCVYRGRGGTACAVGVLVTDAECAGWDRRVRNSAMGLKKAGALPPRFVAHVTLLQHLQLVHDSATDEIDGRARDLRLVAAGHGLVAPA
jgi:hypothetical protein